MKELDYNHSVFSTDLMDLSHYGFKGLLTSHRERPMDVKCSLIKKAPPPDFGVGGLNLNVVKVASSNCQLTRHAERRGTCYVTPQDAGSKLW